MKTPAPSLFTDATETTPATNGDGVGRAKDVSGNGRHLDQADPARRPTLSETTPAERADAIAVAGGKRWAAEMLGLCHTDAERADLLENTTDDSLTQQSFAALESELRVAGLESEWEERETELCQLEINTVLATYAELRE